MRLHGYKYLFIVVLVIAVGIAGFAIWSLQNNNSSESNMISQDGPNLLGGWENRGDEPNQMGDAPLNQTATFTSPPD